MEYPFSDWGNLLPMSRGLLRDSRVKQKTPSVIGWRFGIQTGVNNYSNNALLVFISC